MKKYHSLLILILLIPVFVFAFTETEAADLKLEFSTSDDASINTYALFGVSDEAVNLDTVSENTPDLKSTLLLWEDFESSVATTQYLWWKVASTSSGHLITVTVPALVTDNLAEEALIPDSITFGLLSEDSSGCDITTTTSRGTLDIAGRAVVDIKPITVGFRGCLPFTITLSDSELDKALADCIYHAEVKIAVESIE